jgi:hypothetical protein
MVFNATFKNISVILWWSVLLMEETGVLEIPTFRLYLKFIYAVFWFILCSENHRPVASQWQTIIYRVHLAMSRIQTYNLSGDRC